MQKKPQISLNQNFYHDEYDRPSSIPTPHHVSTGLKLSYDDEERNSSITSASASMTLAPSIMSSFGDSITNELDRHKEEFERYIMIQVCSDSAFQLTYHIHINTWMEIMIRLLQSTQSL